jgi:peptidoglycan/LPS O-acetylase OafA/YrhL
VRIAQIDSLRAIAALGVVVSHVAVATGYDASWRGLTHRLNIGVPIFFVISGFVLYRPFVAARRREGDAPDLRAYALRRLVRIVPAYWLALTVLAAWPGLHGVFSSHFWVYYGFAQIYGHLSHSGDGLFPAWTLCVEVTFYAMLPLFGLATARAARRWGHVRADVIGLLALVAIASLWRGLFWADGGRNTGAFLWLPFYLDWFVPGMALAVLSVARHERAGDHRLGGRAGTAAWLGAVAGFLILWRLAGDDGASWRNAEVNAFLYALIGLLLVAPAALDVAAGPVHRLLRSRVLLWLGAISYGIYLWHFPLAIEFHHRFASPFVVFAATLAATVAAAAVSWYAMERPLMRRTRSYRAARTAHTTMPPLEPEPVAAGS